jgi:hypothetical protein
MGEFAWLFSRKSRGRTAATIRGTFDRADMRAGLKVYK